MKLFVSLSFGENDNPDHSVTVNLPDGTTTVLDMYHGQIVVEINDSPSIDIAV